MRESLNAFDGKIVQQEQRLNESIIGFEKKVDDPNTTVKVKSIKFDHLITKDKIEDIESVE